MYTKSTEMQSVLTPNQLTKLQFELCHAKQSAYADAKELIECALQLGHPNLANIVSYALETYNNICTLQELIEYAGLDTIGDNWSGTTQWDGKTIRDLYKDLSPASKRTWDKHAELAKFLAK